MAGTCRGQALGCGHYRAAKSHQARWPDGSTHYMNSGTVRFMALALPLLKNFPAFNGMLHMFSPSHAEFNRIRLSQGGGREEDAILGGCRAAVSAGGRCGRPPTASGRWCGGTGLKHHRLHK